jgi:uncharacterized protein
MGLFVAPFAPNSERYKNIARVVNALFTQFQSLQQSEGGHDPQWAKVAINDTIPGWRRFPPADEWIRNNEAVAGGGEQDVIKAQFFQFLDARAKAAGTPPLNASQKEVLFDQFRNWQTNPGAAPPAPGATVGSR